MLRHAFAAGVCALLVCAACERPKAPVNGLGGFELVETTLASVQSKSLACHEGEDYTRCWIDARQSILGRVPQIELDFAGKTPDAVLAEILMELPGCRMDELGPWFVERLGEATEKSDEHLLWEQKYIVLRVDLMPPARCRIRAVSPVDTARVEKLKS